MGTDDAQNVCCKHSDNWESILVPFEKLEEWEDWDSDKHLEIPDECPLIDGTLVHGKLEDLPEWLTHEDPKIRKMAKAKFILEAYQEEVKKCNAQDVTTQKVSYGVA